MPDANHIHQQNSPQNTKTSRLAGGFALSRIDLKLSVKLAGDFPRSSTWKFFRYNILKRRKLPRWLELHEGSWAAPDKMGDRLIYGLFGIWQDRFLGLTNFKINVERNFKLSVRFFLEMRCQNFSSQEIAFIWVQIKINNARCITRLIARRPQGFCSSNSLESCAYCRWNKLSLGLDALASDYEVNRTKNEFMLRSLPKLMGANFEKSQLFTSHAAKENKSNCKLLKICQFFSPRF